ncbi:MAG: hypothetical protein HC881_04460 [Leptolyngbyaceae cyanobacterium SL_7_1]|nr:hypothetical protein [Leptolyngbyaceae cyanobacterium SL_7_1]
MANAPTIGSEFRVNTFTPNDQTRTSIARDSAGNFVVVWESDGQDGSQTGIYAQRFDSNGNPLGSEFRVNSFTSGFQRDPDVAMDVAGNFVITWQGDGEVVEGDDTGVYAQRYSNTGAALGDPILVSSFPDAPFGLAIAPTALESLSLPGAVLSRPLGRQLAYLRGNLTQRVRRRAIHSLSPPMDAIQM